MRVALDIDSTIKKCQALIAAGKPGEAREAAEAALPQAEGTIARWRCLAAIGNAAKGTEDYAGALDAHAESLHLAEAAGEYSYVARSWNNLGGVFLTASAFDLAVDCYAQVTENRVLARAWPPYHAHGNLALCHLHLDQVAFGIPEVRQALRLESPELIAHNPHSPVSTRYTFVQLALQGNRVGLADIRERALEAASFAARYPDPRSDILAALAGAAIEVAYGDRAEGIAAMERQLALTANFPHVRNDALFCLVQAERIADRPDRAMMYLDEWGKHLFPDGPQRAKVLGLTSWLSPEVRLGEQMSELALAMRPTLPPSIRKLLELK